MIQHIAPVTAVVLKNACQMGCVPSEPTAATNKSRKQWLRRWRRRWGAVMGSIAPREQVPASIIHAKAFLTRKKTFGCMGCDFRSPFSNDSTESGSKIWLHFWGRLFVNDKHAVQIPDPFVSRWTVFFLVAGHGCLAVVELPA